MTMHELKIFEEKHIRTVWDEVQEKWYFGIIDIVQILTESKDYHTARKYWNKLKQRLVSEGNETVTNCHQLKLRAADGKLRYSDVADLEQMLRLVQSIPSKKAEPIKCWLAEVGAERIKQMQDPELGIQQSLMDYKRLGYSDNWINQRLKSIEIRKDLTDQWKAHNVEEGVGYATLTDIIYQAWAGLTAREYKNLKGLHQENLRDNMTNEELVMNMLAELTTTNITKEEHPQTMSEHARVAERGGSVARVAKEAFEEQTGKKVVSSLSMKQYLESQQPKLDLEDEQ